jgi:hypothetical protein
VASAQRSALFGIWNQAEFWWLSGLAAQRIDPRAQQPVLCYQLRTQCLQQQQQQQQQQPQGLLTKKDKVMATARAQIPTGYNHRAAYIHRLQRLQKSIDTSTDPYTAKLALIGGQHNNSYFRLRSRFHVKV